MITIKSRTEIEKMRVAGQLTGEALKLIEKATEAGAAGIMDVNFQITGTTVFMYGIAYK